MSIKDYNQIAKLSSVHWFYDTFLAKLNMFCNESMSANFRDIHSLISKLFGIVKGLASDNMELNNKMDKLLMDNVRLNEQFDSFGRNSYRQAKNIDIARKQLTFVTESSANDQCLDSEMNYDVTIGDDLSNLDNICETMTYAEKS